MSVLFSWLYTTRGFMQNIDGINSWFLLSDIHPVLITTTTSLLNVDYIVWAGDFFFY